MEREKNDDSSIYKQKRIQQNGTNVGDPVEKFKILTQTKGPEFAMPPVVWYISI